MFCIKERIKAARLICLVTCTTLLASHPAILTRTHRSQSVTFELILFVRERDVMHVWKDSKLTLISTYYQNTSHPHSAHLWAYYVYCIGIPYVCFHTAHLAEIFNTRQARHCYPCWIHFPNMGIHTPPSYTIINIPNGVLFWQCH